MKEKKKMWITRISLDLYGDTFSPKELLKELKFSYIVFNSNEIKDFKFPNKDETYGFGSLSLLAPRHYGLQGDLVDYENWYIDIIKSNISLFEKHEVTEINLFMDVFFTKECNFEIFSRDGLAKIGKFKVAIPISIYKLPEEEIIEMLKEADFTKERIQEFIQENK